MPAEDRTWDGSDYSKAAGVLKEILASDATQLPRYGSVMSGPVFARIISRQNFTLFNNESLDARQRFLAAASLMEGLGTILLAYATATTEERIFDAEMIELMRYTLDLSAEVTRRAEAFSKTLTPDDYRSRENGRQQMRDGFARIIKGCVDSLSERQVYKASDRQNLAQTLDAAAPVIFGFLSTSVQQELMVQIQQIIEQEPNPDVKLHLNHLVASLSKLKS